MDDGMNDRGDAGDMMEEKGEGPGTQPVEESRIQETPEEEIIRLKAELDAKAREAQENYNRFLRAAADLDNYRKRAEKEKADLISYANEGLLSEILTVIDNFERALAHAGDEGNLTSLRQGMDMTVVQIYAVFKKYGLDEVKAIGERFDPSVHHAISHEETAEVAPGIVVKEFQKGYLLKGRLLRPSMVAVAKAPEAQ
jgi:molecular chaperone GrpE